MGIELLHPHTEATINDYSTIADVASSTGTIGRFVSKAETGPDNDIRIVSSVREYINTYGTINFRKYGQAQYNAIAWLSSDAPIAYTRVLPYMEEDPDTLDSLQPSTYAVSIFEIGVKKIVDPLVDTKKLKIRMRTLGDGLNPNAPAIVEKNIRTVQAIKETCLALPTAPEADGFTYYPLFALKDKHRGIARTNRLAYNIKLNSTNDDTFTYRLYNFNTFLETTDGLRAVTKDSSFLVSFYKDAQNINGESQFIGDVLETYSSFFDFIYVEDSYDEIYDIVTTYVNDSGTVPLEKIDFLTLTERSIRGVAPETIHSGCTFETGSAVLAGSISKPYFKLDGGSDGDWVGPNSYETLLYKAYSGNGDEISEVTGINVYDTHFYKALDTNIPYDIVLDANYPQSVRNAMVTTALSRVDHMVFFDTGFTANYRQAIKKRQELLNYSTYLAAIFTHDFVIDDPYGNRPISVTSTYDLAKRIPAHDSSTGRVGLPFVGPRRGGVSGFQSINWTPSPSAKEELYNNEVNYIERDEGEYNWMGQLTTQFYKSALSDISHVRPLFLIKRAAIKIANRYRFETTSAIDNTMANLQKDINDMLQRYVKNGDVLTASGRVYASDYEKKQKMARIDIDLTFDGVIERFFININVNG